MLVASIDIQNQCFVVLLKRNLQEIMQHIQTFLFGGKEEIVFLKLNAKLVFIVM